MVNGGNGRKGNAISKNGNEDGISYTSVDMKKKKRSFQSVGLKMLSLTMF